MMSQQKNSINLFKQIIIRNKSTKIEKLAVTPNKYNSKSSGFNIKPVLPNGLFYHPAPSAPTPLITPKTFLPNEDIRKTDDLYFNSEDYKSKIQDNLTNMPIISKFRNPKSYHMTKEQIEELQILRNEGKLSRKELCEKYKISDYFLSISTDSNPETISKEKLKILNNSSKWNYKTKKARELKEKRKIMWEKDL
ncbi:hypothetical protein B5S28_g917 [[Candida] boidinii]|nr:hypothetical protein B5S28_g917 [[Candida] boidinii]